MASLHGMEAPFVANCTPKRLSSAHLQSNFISSLPLSRHIYLDVEDVEEVKCFIKREALEAVFGELEMSRKY